MKKLIILTITFFSIMLISGCNIYTSANETNEISPVYAPHEATFEQVEASETWSEFWTIDNIYDDKFIVYKDDDELTIPKTYIEKNSDIVTGRIIALWFHVDTLELVSAKIIK